MKLVPPRHGPLTFRPPAVSPLRPALRRAPLHLDPGSMTPLRLDAQGLPPPPTLWSGALPPGPERGPLLALERGREPLGPRLGPGLGAVDPASTPDPLARLDAASRASWTQYGEDYAKATRAALEASRPFYEAALANGHPHAEMMRALGFEWREDGVGVPELGALIQAIEGRFDAMIRDGQLTEADVMRPARVFVGADGERFAVPYGQPVPEGARPDSGVIELGFVLEMMRDGHFILGDHGSFNSPEDLHRLLTVFLHDMGHWTAFAENPAYMKAVRALSGEMAARGVSWDTDVDLARRFTFVLENVSVIDAEHRPELLKTFGLDRDVPVTAEAMRHRARRLSPRQLGERVDATLALFARVGHPYGGSNRDLIQNPVRHAQESDSETAGQ